MFIKKERNRFRVELEDIPTTSTLNKLEALEFTKSHLALLTECEELFDTDSRTRYPAKLDVSDIRGVFFSGLDEHSRLVQAFQVIEDENGQEYDYSQEYEDDEEHKEYFEENKEDSSDIHSTIYEGVVFRCEGFEMRTGRVVVYLESKDGDSNEVIVVKNVQGYLDKSQYAGAIYLEEVKSELTDTLASYDLEDGELEKVLGKVREALIEEGVRFYEV